MHDEWGEEASTERKVLFLKGKKITKRLPNTIQRPFSINIQYLYPMKKPNQRKQGNQYDKILKENIQAVIPNLMKNVLGITAVSTTKLPDYVQHTKERKADVLERITDIHGNTFVLQIEFQVKDEPEMAHRMADYFVMLDRKYKIPVEQFVIYIGEGSSQISPTLVRKRMTFEYPLISFSELDYEIFLKSNKPEEVILGILASFKNEQPEKALQQIINRIDETSDGDFAFKKYFKQLRVLSQLRNLDLKLKTVMDSIANLISEERDVLYIRGQEKEQTKFVTNLLEKLDLTIDQIADIAGVSVDFVETVKKKLADKK
jgi:predicted transposase YdaD